MRTALTTAILTLALGLGACATSEPAAEVESAAADMAAMQEMSPEEMMAAFAEANAMNENHARMARFVGDWDVAMKTWMEPGQPPMESTGSASFELILGGRYLRQDYSASMMGMPYSGMGIGGYDNARETHVDYWFDDMGTAGYVSSGDWDEAGTTFTAIGEHMNALTKQTERMKHVLTMNSPDRFVFTMYMAMPDGEWTQSMELTYTRRR